MVDRSSRDRVRIVRADLADPCHADALIDLLRCYALDPMGGGRDLSASVQANLAAALHAREGVDVLLAYAGGEAVGLVICMEGFSTFQCRPLLNIHDVIVKRDCRGRGVAASMLAEVERIALERGCCKLTLEVLEGNNPARSLYAGCGFRGYELDPAMGKALFLEKRLG